MTDTIPHRTKSCQPAWRRRATGLWLGVSIVLLQGCAAIQEPFHQLRYCNIGVLALTSVKIKYGDVTWPLTPEGRVRTTDSRCLSGGASTSGPMQIPNTMQVAWTTEDGRKHTASVPIRARLNLHHPTHTVEVRFSNDQIEVYERVFPTETQRIDYRIYP